MSLNGAHYTLMPAICNSVIFSTNSMELFSAGPGLTAGKWSGINRKYFHLNGGQGMEQEQSSAILKGLRLKVTPQRLEVMRCLGEERAYLSAEEIWHRVRPGLGSIGLPTVYRILDELAAAQVVSRIFRADRRQYYFLCTNRAHHHHFVCDACRRVEDMDLCGLDDVTREIARRSGGRALSHILQVNGLCAECSREVQP